LKKLDGGFNIFDELDEYLQEQSQEAVSQEETSVPREVNILRNPRPKAGCRLVKKKAKRLSFTRATEKSDRFPSTPITSKKSAMVYSAAMTPSMLTFSSSSSVTTTTLRSSTLARFPHHHLSQSMARLTLHPLLAPTRGFPSALLPISYPGMEGVAGVSLHPTASLDGNFLAQSPKGSGFGAFEAANTLLGLSGSTGGPSRTNERTPTLDLTL
jgi:hypothetical protein